MKPNVYQDLFNPIPYPKLIILRVPETYARVKHLLNGMVNPPQDGLVIFGQNMVDLMKIGPQADPHAISELLGPLMRGFELFQSDDPGFDQRILYEAITFGAGVYYQAWSEQAGMFNLGRYKFERWFGDDLSLRYDPSAPIIPGLF